MEGRENNESNVDLALGASKRTFFLNTKGPSIVILLAFSILGLVAVVYIGSTTERLIAYAVIGPFVFAIASLLHTLREHVLRK